MLRLASFVSLLCTGFALPDGLGRTPVMGMNSWTAWGCGVTASDLLDVGNFFVSSGLRDKGYSFVNTDDCWMGKRNATTGEMTPNYNTFPQGISGLTASLHALGLKFGIYSAASSVVCSGNAGSLFYEQLDAQTFASWDVDLIKYDNCGEYSYGAARFIAFADAVAATGRPMLISTEPFLLVPNPIYFTFAHYWRTGNDISADWNTIINRADMNARWADFGTPGGFNDPDMLQVGNGALTDAECRTHFGLWAISKSPLILGTNVLKLSPTQLAIVGNEDIIAVNQDPLGRQARKLARDLELVPYFVGLAPCWTANINTTTAAGPGYNGVTMEGLQWSVTILNATARTITLSNGASPGRCLSLRNYTSSALIPVLTPCDAADATQAWTFPPASNGLTGGITSLTSVATGLALGVANSTLFSSLHGQDTQPVPDAAYGIMSLTLFPPAPEPVCSNRGCQDYDPTQSWYYSPRLQTITLANAEANGYRCYEGPCYQLTSHLSTTATHCLAKVASVSNDGLNPMNLGTADVWGGPLANGDYAFGLVNRGAATNSVTVSWSMLEAPGIGDATAACVRELYTGATMNVTGSATFQIASHDMAFLRVTFSPLCV